jgi:hypothetical protein
LFVLLYWKAKVIQKVVFYKMSNPPTPHGRLSNFLDIDKSPLVDLGVRSLRRKVGKGV